MKLKIENKNLELITIPVYNSKKEFEFFNKTQNKEIKNKIKDTAKLYQYIGKENETLYFNIDKQKILLIGLKEEYTLENLRIAYSNVHKIIKSKDECKISIEVPKEQEDEIVAIIEGIDLSDYKFNKYIKEKKENEIEIIIIINKKYQKILNETLIITKNTKITRDLVNENSNIITPQYLEQLSKDLAKKNKLKIKVLNEKQIQKEKLNLLYAVGQGSIFPPRLIIVEYNGNPKSKEKIALVGKGITFDTGGTNLKPTGFVEDMKSDMGGAATVYSIFKSAIELKLKQNLILVIPSAENSLSANAFKPGDVFIGYNQLSVEIGNTDAEGRLILADAIAYIQKNYKPTQIIDMATLTGACLVALGTNLIAMLGNNKKIKKQIFESGEKTFDRVWELPIYDEHRESIKSKIADMKNIGANRYGGTITAAAFLEKFIEKNTKWTHLDIAGAARSHGKVAPYITDFGTGRGVRLIVDYIKNNQK
ncbi:MAG: leucyl aminopeptidase family protein [Candidatus Woesearchaeota archaeon]|jgi:leucyl aminopeptidase|nr:leucyl aminopeptidase family protein [Candidatus Woesearchaeota archaeon]